MHVAFTRTEHRPWPLPHGRWTWRQSWKDLLFAHWPVPASVLRPLVPPGLAVQEFGGSSWVGVVPFRMSGVMRRPLQEARGDVEAAELLEPHRLSVRGSPLLHFSKGVDVVVWPSVRVAEPDAGCGRDFQSDAVAFMVPGP